MARQASDWWSRSGEVRFADDDRATERNRCLQIAHVDVPIGRSFGDMIVPTTTDRVIEEDTLEAMVGFQRPAAITGESRECLPRQCQPFGLEDEPVHPARAQLELKMDGLARHHAIAASFNASEWVGWAWQV